MPRRSRADVLAEQASFIFSGTVLRLRDATLDAVQDRENTVVVRVDEVLHAPEALLHTAGQEITVQLARGETVDVGMQAVFYTSGWLFGESIAVQSLGHVTPSARAVATAEAPSPTASFAARELQDRLADSDLVVAGKVSAVRLPASEPPSGPIVSSAQVDPAGSLHVSEHDPMWREAVIEVDAVEKGEHPGKSVVVRFPSSTDVQWYEAPKFQPGQQGVFILRQEKPSVPEGALAAARPDSEETFTALHPADVRSWEQLPTVQRVLQTENVQQQASGESR